MKRRSIRVEDLSDEEVQAIASAEPSERSKALDRATVNIVMVPGTPTVEDERAAIVTYIRARIASVAVHIERGRINADEGSQLGRGLTALGDEIAAGLHAGE